MKYFYPLGISMDKDGQVMAHVFLSTFLRKSIVPFERIDSEFIRRYSPLTVSNSTSTNTRTAKDLQQACANKGDILEEHQKYLTELDVNYWKKAVFFLKEWDIHEFKNVVMHLNFILKNFKTHAKAGEILQFPCADERAEYLRSLAKDVKESNGVVYAPPYTYQNILKYFYLAT